MSKRDNAIPLFVDSRLLTVINGKAGLKNQRNATYIMGLLVEFHKELLTPEAYAELKLRYSKTVEQQRKEKLERERKALIEKQKDNERKDRELTLREQNAKVFQQQTKRLLNKDTENKIRELKARRERLEGINISDSEFGHEKELIEQIDKELATLTAVDS